jgi:hypothetical protein
LLSVFGIVGLQLAGQLIALYIFSKSKEAIETPSVN